MGRGSGHFAQGRAPLGCARPYGDPACLRGGALLVAAGIAGEFQEIERTVISWKSFLGLAYLIVFGSIIAFTSYTWLLQRCPPALVATHTYANPLVAVLLGWLVASEPLTIRVLMASAVILASIVLIRRGERSAIPRSTRNHGPTKGDAMQSSWPTTAAGYSALTKV